jgi:hypothetical protein
VTATLTDASSQVWANASWQVQLVPPFNNPNQLLNNGNVITDQLQTGFANGSGLLSITMDDNTAITPKGSFWRFTICPNATVLACTTISVTVSGTTQDLSSTLSSQLTPIAVQANTTVSRAYATTEASAGQGGIFWRVSDNTLWGCTGVCTGTNWLQIAGSGGGSITGVTAGNGLNGGGTTGNVTLAVNSPLVDNLTGNASTATAFATLPTPCSTGQAPTGIDVHGNSVGCATAGGTATVTTVIPLENCTGDQTNNVFYTTAGLTNYFNAHWEVIPNTITSIYCQALVPNNVAVTPNANIVVWIASNDGTAGHTAVFGICDNVVLNASGTSSINVGALTCGSTTHYVTTSTAYARAKLTFSVSSTVLANNLLIIQIAMTTSGTPPAADMFVTAYLQIDQTL